MRQSRVLPMGKFKCRLEATRALRSLSLFGRRWLQDLRCLLEQSHRDRPRESGPTDARRGRIPTDRDGMPNNVARTNVDACLLPVAASGHWDFPAARYVDNA
jgi:hypothetical protein